MTIPYVKFMKHAQKVTKTAMASRPILKGVNHTSDGKLVTTDAHRLYIAGGFDERDEPVVINPKSGETVDGKFPDVDRLIPNSDPQFIANINVNQAHDVFKHIVGLAKVAGDQHVDLTVDGCDLFAHLGASEESVISAQYKLDDNVINSGNADEIMVNPTYILDALALFKDCGIETATFNSFGRMRPFTITADEKVTALISPIRKGA